MRRRPSWDWGVDRFFVTRRRGCGRSRNAAGKIDVLFESNERAALLQTWAELNCRLITANDWRASRFSPEATRQALNPVLTVHHLPA